MNRRSFFAAVGGVLGWLGLGLAAKAVPSNSERMLLFGPDLVRLRSTTAQPPKNKLWTEEKKFEIVVTLPADCHVTDIGDGRVEILKHGAGGPIVLENSSIAYIDFIEHREMELHIEIPSRRTSLKEIVYGEHRWTFVPRGQRT